MSIAKMVLRLGIGAVDVVFGGESQLGCQSNRWRYTCKAALVQTTGTIILTLIGTDATCDCARRLIILNPANSLIQRNGSHYLVDFQDSCSPSMHLSFCILLPADYVALVDSLDSAATNWPLQKRVDRVMRRYQHKVLSLYRHGRPSRAVSVACARTRGGTARFPQSSACETGAAGDVDESPIDSTSQDSCIEPPSEADGIFNSSRDLPVTRATAGSLSSAAGPTPTPRVQGLHRPRGDNRRARSTGGRLQEKKHEVSSSECETLCSSALRMLYAAMSDTHGSSKARSGHHPVGGRTGGRGRAQNKRAANGTANMQTAFTEQAASVVKTYLPQFAYWIQRFDRLRSQLQIVHQRHVSGSTASYGSTLKQPAQNGIPKAQLLRAGTDKELVLLVSFLTEAASCTLLGRNGLSRRQHKRFLHNLRDNAMGRPIAKAVRAIPEGRIWKPAEEQPRSQPAVSSSLCSSLPHPSVPLSSPTVPGIQRAQRGAAATSSVSPPFAAVRQNQRAPLASRKQDQVPPLALQRGVPGAAHSSTIGSDAAWRGYGDMHDFYAGGQGERGYPAGYRQGNGAWSGRTASTTHHPHHAQTLCEGYQPRYGRSRMDSKPSTVTESSSVSERSLTDLNMSARSAHYVPPAVPGRQGRYGEQSAQPYTSPSGYYAGQHHTSGSYMAPPMYTEPVQPGWGSVYPCRPAAAPPPVSSGQPLMPMPMATMQVANAQHGCSWVMMPHAQGAMLLLPNGLVNMYASAT